jgi:hypothetical protein
LCGGWRFGCGPVSQLGETGCAQYRYGSQLSARACKKRFYVSCPHVCPEPVLANHVSFPVPYLRELHEERKQRKKQGAFFWFFSNCLVVYISPAVSPVLARNFQASSISPPPAETTRLLFNSNQTTFMLYVCPEPALANTRLLA